MKNINSNSMSKQKLKNRLSSIEEFKLRCIEIVPIQEIFIKKKLTCDFYHFYHFFSI
jgi:hypothetical protein